MSYYRYHLFFCVNQRNEGKACCAAVGAQSTYEYAKQRLKKLGLHAMGACRANTSSCLGRCEEGPVLVIYPDAIWYRYHSHKDIDEIIEQHIQQAKVVKRLQLRIKSSE